MKHKKSRSSRDYLIPNRCPKLQDIVPKLHNNNRSNIADFKSDQI